MEACSICDTPLEDGYVHGGPSGLTWAAEPGPDAEDAEIEAADSGMAASRCPECRVGVFSYAAETLATHGEIRRGLAVVADDEQRAAGA